jgi:hypothetical protein
MAATTTAHDELPTSRYAAVPRRGPPPLPARAVMPLAPRAPRLVSVRLPSVVPRALAKATLTIELPVDELNDQEIATITAWLHGRGSCKVVPMKSPPPPRVRALDRVTTAMVASSRGVRARLRGGLKAALVWTLALLTSRASKG